MTEAFNCNDCGSQLNSESSFCGSCGATVRQSQDVGDQDTDVARTPNLLAGEDQQSGGARMATVRRVGVMSVGKIGLVTYGLIAGVVGVLAALVTLFTTGPLAALGLLIGIPIGYGVIGFLGGIFTAWLYNLVAGWVGGIKIELS
jgi:hypothetical protein